MENQSHLEVIRQKMMLPPPPRNFQDREALVSYVRDFGANQGYVVTIKKSRKDRRVILGCDRGGVYRTRRKMEEMKRKRKVHSRLINCPFEAIGRKADDEWVLTIKNGEHNHEPLKDMSEHPYSRRFTEEEVKKIKLMTEAGIKPSQVLKALKQNNPELHSTPRNLYNLKARIRQGNISEKSFKAWRPNRSVVLNASTGSSSNHECPMKVPNLIGGKFLDSQACAIIDVVNPATQEVVSQVPLTTYEEFKAAVSAAKQAFPSWKHTPITTRQRIMFKFQELIRRDIDKLAMNITMEQGKTLNGAKADLLCGLEVVEHSCGMASLQIGEFVPNASNGIDTYCTREPLGVCAGICPFNFPATISLWMFPIAVTCGNTFILKTSEKNPGASMILASLAMEAGLPDGVLNVVHGTNDIINHICDDDDIKALSFAGSNAAGMHVYVRAAARGKRVQSNMGAKNYAIIMPDASADATLDALVAAGFGAAGQGCMSLGTALFVGGSISWEEELMERAKALKVNVGTESGAHLGPVITKEAKNQICRLVQSGVESGARLILDGRNIMVPGYEHGNFVGPTILCDVTSSMECYKEEIFGPVLVCMQADSLEDAISVVNRNNLGNGASIFTTSGVAARNFQNEIEAGLVGINVPVPIPLPFSSFNGLEGSCAGALNFCGKEGLQFYTQIKKVAQKWKDLPSRRVSLPPLLTSETEITSRGVSLALPQKSESDLYYREGSPTMPSASRRYLPNHSASLLLTPTSARDLPNSGALSSIPPTMDRDLQNQRISLTIPTTSPNQGLSPPIPPSTERQLSGLGVSLSMSQTSETLYFPRTSQWDESLPITYQRSENTPTSERIYIAPASQRNDNMGSAPQLTDVAAASTSERASGPTLSQRIENFGLSQRSDSERVFGSTAYSDDNVRLLSLGIDTTIHPASERIYMATPAIPYRNDDASPSQRNKNM